MPVYELLFFIFLMGFFGIACRSPKSQDSLSPKPNDFRVVALTRLNVRSVTTICPKTRYFVAAVKELRAFGKLYTTNESSVGNQRTSVQAEFPVHASHVN